ncbi:TraR/DksA C4-type zinc finger protein [Acidovorax sp. A1169]|uniref:TraR/DksA family transcriptional regulator n=1 Tax=Acidovorax sp. A1169 TaxID=3059524 RepID=UPI002737A24E|nr:TraR/DksA C4-type zinc finger protein [Acidovorax sp. A1169]MDP4076362.1 TraR/DksA C4-type zinc finger protein [Acidovorax sp. A1169]
MNTIAHLSHAQRISLATLLQSRVTELKVQRALQLQGVSQVEAARMTLLGDADDAPQQSGMHEVDSAILDMHIKELDEIEDAVRRIQGAGYGLCIDCLAAIPFQRLSVEPQTLRCVACESRHERDMRA